MTLLHRWPAASSQEGAAGAIGPNGMPPIYSAHKCVLQEAGESQGVCAPLYAHYNFVRVHRTLRFTPAMATGVTDRLWSVGEWIDAAMAVKGAFK